MYKNKTSWIYSTAHEQQQNLHISSNSTTSYTLERYGKFKVIFCKGIQMILHTFILLFRRFWKNIYNKRLCKYYEEYWETQNGKNELTIMMLLLETENRVPAPYLGEFQQNNMREVRKILNQT